MTLTQKVQVKKDVKSKIKTSYQALHNVASISAPPPPAPPPAPHAVLRGQGGGGGAKGVLPETASLPIIQSGSQVQRGGATRYPGTVTAC